MAALQIASWLTSTNLHQPPPTSTNLHPPPPTSIASFRGLHFPALGIIMHYAQRPKTGGARLFRRPRHLLLRRPAARRRVDGAYRSEEHTSEVQSHSFISYAVFCL